MSLKRQFIRGQVVVFLLSLLVWYLFTPRPIFSTQGVTIFVVSLAILEAMFLILRADEQRSRTQPK